ncbi:type I-B CRISPR-associated protein Cas8b1/Cst1 [Acetoanaerobium pronyense]|nr:type I-B CRISPR-associated protein Cas8b1/Cst1 [Acetoanaerobium pronyense]
MGDWQLNAGIVGFINIMNHKSEHNINIKEHYIEFSKEHLIGFSEKYFNYLIDTYKPYTSWYKIVSYEESIKKYEDNDYTNFDEKSLDNLNKYIKDILKKYIKSNSYKAAFDLISIDINILDMEKQLSPIKLKKGSDIQSVLPEIKKQLALIKDIIAFFKENETKKYVLGKNVIYQFIKNSWNGVSLLNPQTKEKDFYEDYNSYFVNPLIEYIETDKIKYKFQCFSCDSKMKDMKNTLSFLNHTGFDTVRKASHAWNFSNDIAICELCKLMYSCMPAGITYAYNKGIFVNENSSIEKLVKINTNLKSRIFSYDSTDRDTHTYRALINSFEKEHEEKLKYELADIQIIRYEQISSDENRYKFNILSKNLLETIMKSKKYIDYLSKANYKENGERVNIYEATIDRLFNNQNMYTLIHKCILYKASAPKDNYYNDSHMLSLLKINVEYLKGVGYLENKGLDIVDNGSRQGYFLKQAYKDKGSVDKVNGICYRLLNSLKTSNQNAFMDTLINCYLYVKKPVPQIFMETLKDEDVFKTVGYAFVAGLTGEIKETQITITEGDE